MVACSTGMCSPAAAVCSLADSSAAAASSVVVASSTAVASLAAAASSAFFFSTARLSAGLFWSVRTMVEEICVKNIC